MVVVSHLFPFYRKILPNYSYFNPRLREGGDAISFRLLISPSLFQSTPPRRRRQLSPQGICTKPYFNPRLHEGGDALCPCTLSVRHYFNPRLHEGGDDNNLAFLVCIAISIHASMKEATYLLWMGKRKWMISIHASMKEATATYCDTPAIMYISSLNNFFVRYF